MMLKIDQLRSVMELYPSTIWAKRAGVVLGVLRIEREPVEAAKLLRVVQPDMPVLDEKTLQSTLPKVFFGGDASGSGNRC